MALALAALSRPVISKLAHKPLLFYQVGRERKVKVSTASSRYWREEAPRELREALPTAAGIVSSLPGFLQPHLRLLRLDKPIGSWLLFLPCSWSIALASAPAMPSLELLALFAGGSVLMRSAGCIINDLWDAELDRQVERTRDRPLASGALGRPTAYFLLSTTLLSSLWVLLHLNWLSVFLGLSSMGLVVAYPLAKRYTNWPQLVLGATINWGALLGWTAVTGDLNIAPALCLYAAGICWSFIYDTIYAHQDREDDAIVGVGSTALALGPLWTKPACSLAAVLLFTALHKAGTLAELGQLYDPVLVIAAIRLAAIIWRVNLGSSESCWEAFRANRNAGLIVFAAILLGALSKPDSETSPLPVIREAWRRIAL